MRSLRLCLETIDEYAFDDDEINHKVWSWMTVVLHRSRLRTFSLTGIELPETPISALQELHGNTLMRLKLEVNEHTVQTVKVISMLPSLQSLDISFNSPSPSEVHFKDIPPLCMPSVEYLRWEWRILRERSSINRNAGLHYLAQCRFSHTCKFNIYSNGSDPNEAAILNPLFLSHHSRLVAIRSQVPATSSILQYSAIVHFKDCEPTPHPNLFDTADLPPTIVFSYWLGYKGDRKIDNTWNILNILTKSNHTYNTALVFKITWPGSLSSFKWASILEPIPLSQDESEVIVKMLQYTKVLAPKGITICDATGSTLKDVEISKPTASIAEVVQKTED
jgi:hypothetical protein